MKDDPQKGMRIWSLESKPLEKANVEYENPFSESYYQNFKQAAIYLDTNYKLLLNLDDLVYDRIVNFVHYYIFYDVKNRIQFE